MHFPKLESSNLNPMKKLLPQLTVAAVLIISLTHCQPVRQPVTFATLLQDMTELSILSEFPNPEFTCRQFSSYDRRTVAPDQPGWFANGDASWFVREETTQGRREFVMMDAEGPGAIVRFWMTFGSEKAYTGTLRIYIDGNVSPEIEGPVLKIISGGQLVGEPLSSSSSPKSNYANRGHNLYMPIPYASHIKITYECTAMNPEKHSPSVYYNINYRTYASGTKVTSFTLKDLTTYETRVTELLRTLGDLTHPVPANSHTLSLADPEISLNPGQKIHQEFSGSQAIYELLFKIEAENLPQALRSTVLQCTFDDEETVWSPIGDFFGTGYQIRNHHTWHTATDSLGMMHSWWVMPFQKSAIVEVVNLGDQPVRLMVAKAVTGKYRWTSRSMHFGGIWREYHAKSTGDWANEKLEDLNFVTLQGQGVYAGDAITMFNTADAWWGEGDEKVYVDGEGFPSHIGTGTEDYIGYAWCRPETFDHFLIAQPDGSGNFHPGMTINMRHRLLDNIPFNTSLKFDLELWHWAATKVNYGVVSYWYMKPGGKCMVKPDLEVVKLPVSLKRENLYPPVPDPSGMLEGEYLRVVSLSAGSWEIQTSTTWGWSNNAQIWWMDGGVNGIMKAEFEMPSAGEYQITANFTKAVDYGNFKMIINDQSVKKTFIGFSHLPDNPVITEKVSLGRFILNEGINTLQITMTGKQDQAEPRYMVGIDYLQIR